jgi:hypothetical protein
MATIKQMDFIQKLLIERVWDKPVLVANLSVQDASFLIATLKNQPTRKQVALAEEKRLLQEAAEKARAEAEEQLRIELENCERCKNPGAGPGHFSCLYGGRKIGHSRSHCSAKACF